MDFHLVRGTTPDEVESMFLTTQEDEVQAAEEAALDDDDENPTTIGNLPTASGLGRRLIKFDPGPTVRSRGANQLGRATFRNRLNESDGQTYYLVVRNSNKWAETTEQQDYAIAVSMWRDEQHGEIYADLEVRLEVPVEIEIGPG